MALGSCTWQSPYINLPADPTEKQDELASQNPVWRFNAESNKALTEAFTPPETLTLPLVLPSTEDLFTKFIKVFIETTQAQARALAERKNWPLKARSSETYLMKSHMDCYHFCQQCEDHFKTSGTTKMNYTLFVALFFHGTINLRWPQHKCHHQSATPITWSEFKTFL